MGIHLLNQTNRPKMRLLSQKNHGDYTKIRGKIGQSCLEARVG